MWGETSPRFPPTPWLEPDDAFPPVAQAWGALDPAPGLVAAGRDLSAPTLLDAYGQGIFPWFNEGQPILWWSPDPRTVLRPSGFRLHRSLRKTIKRLRLDGRLEVRFDHNFGDVIRECARTPRRDQNGTWIVPDMVAAYSGLHRAGHAHSVETWIDGHLVGGLYAIMIGKMVFGESMFSHRTDASKIALASLVAFALEHELPMIDCQQNTAHMATLGSETMDRSAFCNQVAQHIQGPSPAWQFDPVYWKHFISQDGY
ncbi:MAG: leucyl/phenylalanyl-tRNA--protein transferase [Burkholderiaceae bacterium]